MEKNEANEKAVAEAPEATKPPEDDSYSDLLEEVREAVKARPVVGEDAATDAEPAEEAADEEAVEEDEEAVPPESETEAPPPEGEQGRDAEGKFTRRAPLSDGLLERAVRAGLPMSEAREFPNEKLLSATVDRLESVQKNGAEAKPGDAKKGSGESKTAEDPMAAIDAIPDLSPEVYDEQVVKVVAALKGIAKVQAKELSELRSKGSVDFMAEQLATVKDFTKGDASKEAAVRTKFEVLKAGYKAAGQEVSDVTVFAEASQLVLGGDMKAAANKNKTEAASRRNGQRISRAAGQRVEAKADPRAEIADKINRKFYSQA